MSEENTNLYNVINSLHQTDKLIWTKTEGLSSILEAEINAREEDVTSVSNAIVYISGVVDTEVATRTAETTFISGAVDAEVATRTAETAFISGAVDAEVAARTADVTTLTERVDKIDNLVLGTVKGLDTRVTTAEGEIDALQATAIAYSGALETSGTLGNAPTIKLNVNEDYFSQESGKLTSTLKITKLADAVSDIYAASYQLSDKNGKAVGDIINIPQDQFLSKAEIITAGEVDKNNDASLEVGEKYIKLTFKIIEENQFYPQPVYIAIKNLVSPYTAGAGLILDAKNKFSVVADTETQTTKYLVINDDSIGLKGIDEAIATPVNAISGVVDANTAAIATNASAIAILNSDETVEGSVKYVVYNAVSNAVYVDPNGNKTTVAEAITANINNIAANAAAIAANKAATEANAEAIATLNSDKTVAGSVDYKLAKYDEALESIIAEVEALKAEIQK